MISRDSGASGAVPRATSPGTARWVSGRAPPPDSAAASASMRTMFARQLVARERQHDHLRVRPVALQRRRERGVERRRRVDADVGRHLEVLLERDERQVLARHHLVDRHPDAAGPHLDRARVDVLQHALVVLGRRRHVRLHQVHEREAGEVADRRRDARRRRAVDDRAAVRDHEVGRHAAPARVEEEVVGRREDAADRDVRLRRPGARRRRSR